LIDLCSYEGDDIELAFNPHYIIDACDNMTTEKLKISLSDISSCALIEPLPNKDEEVSYARYLVNRVKM
jgi:DNA polymerase III sliding clamp (beta) subunit (PCNA family)